MDSFLSGVKNVTSAVSDAAVASANKVGDVASSGLHAAKDGVSKVGDAASSGLNAAKDGVSKVGDAASTGLHAAKDGVSKVGDGVGDAGSSFTGGLTSSFTTLTVLHAGTKAKILASSPWILSKVGRIINAMRSSSHKFTDDEIDLVVKSLYVSQSDADLKSAFDMFDAKFNGTTKGYLKGSDFRTVLPLVGEDVPDDKIDALFKEVDKDQSGNLEFDEYRTLMLSMNPIQESGMVMGGLTSLTSGVLGSITTLTVLKANTKAKLMGASPLALGKIGRIIKSMQNSKFQFTDDEVDDVVKALYVTQSDDDFQVVFDLFDKKLSGSPQHSGALSAQSFRHLLPLVGEDVPAEKIDELFTEMDTDGSGNIEFAEFKAMMLAMNPKA